MESHFFYLAPRSSFTVAKSYEYESADLTNTSDDACPTSSGVVIVASVDQDPKLKSALPNGCYDHHAPLPKSHVDI